MLGLPIKWFGASLLLLIAGAGGTLYYLGRGEPIPQLETLPELVYGRVTDAIVAEVQVPPGASRVLLPPFPRDPQDALRRRVADQLEERRGLDVAVPKRRADLLEGSDEWDALLGAVFQEWKQKIITEWTGDRPDFVVLARVKDYTDNEDVVRLEVDWERRLLDAPDDPSGNGTSVGEIPKSWFEVDYARAQISSWSGSWRFGFWLLAMIAPAFLASGLIRKVLEQNSNLANARMVLVFMLPGALAAFVLSALGWGWTGGALTLLGTAIAGAYSFFFCTAVENLRQ